MISAGITNQNYRQRKMSSGKDLLQSMTASVMPSVLWKENLNYKKINWKKMLIKWENLWCYTDDSRNIQKWCYLATNMYFCKSRIQFCYSATECNSVHGTWRKTETLLKCDTSDSVQEPQLDEYYNLFIFFSCGGCG